MSLNDSTVIYPGSFDPLTLGHDDIVMRSLRLADRVVIAVAESSTQMKTPAFGLKERVGLISKVYANEPGVEVVAFSGLLVDFAKQHHSRVIIRGLRAVSDFEYEFQMALMNRSLSPEIEVIFMAPASNYTFLSSSLVREVASLGGDVSQFVPPEVLVSLVQRYGSSAGG
jgi:pantetheine-phosphate adenylyltransferase